VIESETQQVKSITKDSNDFQYSEEIITLPSIEDTDDISIQELTLAINNYLQSVPLLNDIPKISEKLISFVKDPELNFDLFNMFERVREVISRNNISPEQEKAMENQLLDNQRKNVANNILSRWFSRNRSFIERNKNNRRLLYKNFMSHNRESLSFARFSELLDSFSLKINQ
jgi:hypothetical protein